jgi:hypothetical protein
MAGSVPSGNSAYRLPTNSPAHDKLMVLPGRLGAIVRDHSAVENSAARPTTDFPFAAPRRSSSCPKQAVAQPRAPARRPSPDPPFRGERSTIRDCGRHSGVKGYENNSIQDISSADISLWMRYKEMIGSCYRVKRCFYVSRVCNYLCDFHRER